MTHNQIDLRRLQSGDQCYCAFDNIADSQPTEREFLESFSSYIGQGITVTKIRQINVDGVGGSGTRKECESNNDCVAKDKGTLCVNEQCVHEGNPRITLTWEGDDDIDLVVITPVGTVIDCITDYDNVTGGAFDTLYSQVGFGLHAESIFFPLSGGPSGDYKIEVRVYEQRGTLDNWNLLVLTERVEGAQQLLSDSGNGPRDDITFFLGDSTTIGSGECSLDSEYFECCLDSDCDTTGQFMQNCVNRQCITAGVRTFTLTWLGGKFYI
jgi:hypothetical protein